jgi:hypothetical protein
MKAFRKISNSYYALSKQCIVLMEGWDTKEKGF